MKKFPIYPNDTAINANAKASTFARHTKPRHKTNLAKELAFPHTGHILPFGVTQTEEKHGRTGGCQNEGGLEAVFQLLLSISHLYIPRTNSAVHYF